MTVYKSALDEIIQILKDGGTTMVGFLPTRLIIDGQKELAQLRAEIEQLKESQYPGYQREKQIRIGLEKEIERMRPVAKWAVEFAKGTNLFNLLNVVSKYLEAK